jgi:hypothetical protein
MQISRNSLDTAKGPAEWFTGDVYIDTIAAPAGTSTFAAANVHFTPGTRGACVCARPRVRMPQPWPSFWTSSASRPIRAPSLGGSPVWAPTTSCSSPTAAWWRCTRYRCSPRAVRWRVSPRSWSARRSDGPGLQRTYSPPPKVSRVGGAVIGSRSQVPAARPRRRPCLLPSRGGPGNDGSLSAVLEGSQLTGANRFGPNAQARAKRRS